VFTLFPYTTLFRLIVGDLQEQIDDVADDVTDIQAVVPATATTSNKLATMADVSGGGGSKFVFFDEQTFSQNTQKTITIDTNIDCLSIQPMITGSSDDQKYGFSSTPLIPLNLITSSPLGFSVSGASATGNSTAIRYLLSISGTTLTVKQASNYSNVLVKFYGVKF